MPQVLHAAQLCTGYEHALRGMSTPSRTALTIHAPNVTPPHDPPRIHRQRYAYPLHSLIDDIPLLFCGPRLSYGRNNKTYNAHAHASPRACLLAVHVQPPAAPPWTFPLAASPTYTTHTHTQQQRDVP